MCDCDWLRVRAGRRRPYGCHCLVARRVKYYEDFFTDK